MKKRNFIAGFSAAFVAAVALVSCGGIRGKDNVVLTINGIEYTAQDLFGDQKSAASAEAKFNGVYKAAIRTYFAKNNEGSIYNDEITRETKNKVAGAKEEAKSNASKNGTKYDTEWKKILSTNGVDSESGLYDKFEYDLQKTKFEDKFYNYRFDDKGPEGYKTNYDVLRKGGNFRDTGGNVINNNDGTAIGRLNGYIKEKQPYHMKHILVKLSKAKQNGDDNNCLITKDEAKKIYSIIKELAKGTEFSRVAKVYGDKDDSATKNNGSLGIMSRDTSFVNDFKLGVYLYEALYSNSTHTTDDQKYCKPTKASSELFPGVDFSTTITDKNSAAYYAQKIALMGDLTNSNTPSASTNIYSGIGQIPYGEAKLLDTVENGGVGDLDSENEKETERLKLLGVDLKKLKEKYLPRNVIFNKYFNKHNIMVITPNKTAKESKSGETFGTGEKYIFKDSSKQNYERNTISENDDFITKVDETTVQTEPKFDQLLGFTRNAKNDDTLANINSSATISENKNKVLRDENGRTILVFRSGNGSSNSNDSNADSTYQGIHFVVIERSPFIGREFDDGTTSGNNFTDIDEYYTQYYPYQETENYHPVYNNTTEYKKTYTNYIKYEQDVTVLKKRSDDVKTELKKADSNLNTYVYEYLLAKGSIKFTAKAVELGIDTSIKNWIDNTKRGYSVFEKEKNWNEGWEKYYKNLYSRNQNRQQVTEHVSQLVPEFVVQVLTGNTIKYKANIDKTDLTKTTEINLEEMFKEGGVFNA